jgi:hypothetical protein
VGVNWGTTVGGLPWCVRRGVLLGRILGESPVGAPRVGPPCEAPSGSSVGVPRGVASWGVHRESHVWWWPEWGSPVLGPQRRVPFRVPPWDVPSESPVGVSFVGSPVGGPMQWFPTRDPCDGHPLGGPVYAVCPL